MEKIDKLEVETRELQSMQERFERKERKVQELKKKNIVLEEQHTKLLQDFEGSQEQVYLRGWDKSHKGRFVLYSLNLFSCAIKHINLEATHSLVVSAAVRARDLESLAKLCLDLRIAAALLFVMRVSNPREVDTTCIKPL